MAIDEEVARLVRAEVRKAIETAFKELTAESQVRAMGVITKDPLSGDLAFRPEAASKCCNGCD